MIVPREANSVIQESDQPGNILQIRMCKCGRAPHRKALTPGNEEPRNCHFCHKEANTKYRRTIRQQIKAFKAISWVLKNGA